MVSAMIRREKTCEHQYSCRSCCQWQLKSYFCGSMTLEKVLSKIIAIKVNAEPDRALPLWKQKEILITQRANW